MNITEIVNTKYKLTVDIGADNIYYFLNLMYLATRNFTLVRAGHYSSYGKYYL